MIPTSRRPSSDGGSGGVSCRWNRSNAAAVSRHHIRAAVAFKIAREHCRRAAFWRTIPDILPRHWRRHALEGEAPAAFSV